MTWTKLDESYVRHSKRISLGLEGSELWVCSLVESNKLESDGILRREALIGLSPFIKERRAKALIPVLIRQRAWHDQATAEECPIAKCHEAPRPEPSEILIHEFVEYQMPRAKLQAERERKARNTQTWRERRMSGDRTPPDLQGDRVPLRSDPSRETRSSEPERVGSTFSGLLSQEEPPIEAEDVVDLTALESVLSPTETHLLRSICRANSQFAEVKRGQIERLRREPYGGRLLLETLIQLASTSPEDLASVQRPGAILDLRFSEIRAQMEARNSSASSPETAPNAEQKGA